MSPMAIKEILRTALGPKYSLTISVMMNSKGQSSTPQVSVKVSPPSPSKVNGCGDILNTRSSENSLPPMHSAMMALATKKEVRNTKSRVGLSFNMFSSMDS